MRRSRKPRVIYRDSRDRISRIQQAFSLSDEELTGIMLVSPQTTRNWVNGYSHTSRSMRIHGQRIDLLEKAIRDPYESAVIATAISQGGAGVHQQSAVRLHAQGGAGGLSALLMYCIVGETSLKKAVNTRQFMWVKYFLAREFRDNVHAGPPPDKAYRMSSINMALTRLDNLKKHGRR